ncbi:MAG TPA: ribosome recycling factor [Porticoccaceae bacterium]|nr:ribosome recycling factor [Porticoccaceae bacterium]HCO59749.1 ribosome recycling factor [Porticoccaceae bacterium]
MIDELKQDAAERMAKSIEALGRAMNKIRTGRAHPSILEAITVSYYGSETPLSQVANISVVDARTLAISPWEKNLVEDIEKAILKSGLGLNPASAGEVIRIPMPPLTEETRKGFIRMARQEAENSRVSVRNIRRDVLSDFKELLKEKEITEDEERSAQEDVQKLTDRYIREVDEALAEKEKDLMEI